MSTQSLYRRFRAASPFMLVGSNAAQALSAARTLERFEALAAVGRVKIETKPDPDPDPSFYDTWEHLSERIRDELKRRYCEDCVIVSTFYKCAECGAWRLAESICGCSGYRDPASPFDNGYVIDLMSAAVAAAE